MLPSNLWVLCDLNGKIIEEDDRWEIVNRYMEIKIIRGDRINQYLPLNIEKKNQVIEFESKSNKINQIHVRMIKIKLNNDCYKMFMMILYSKAFNLHDDMKLTQSYINILPLPSLLRNSQGKIVLCNNAFVNWSNLKPSEVIGNNMLSLFEGLNDFWEESNKELIEYGGIQKYEAFIKINNNRKTVIFSESINEESERSDEILVMITDFSTQKNIEKALSDSEKKYHNLLESIQEGIWEVNEDEITTYVNREMGNILGYSKKEMLGKSLFEFMDEKEFDNCAYYLNKRKRGVVENHEFKFRHNDGDDVYTLISTNPIIDKNGKYKGALAAIIDITKRKKFEMNLKKAIEERDFLIREVHHRVKNNLQIIASLLFFELSKNKNQDYKYLVAQMKSRIDLLSIFHDQLYQRQNFMKIEFSKFINKLFDYSRMRLSREKTISISAKCDHFFLHIDDAIPCALIINELIILSSHIGFNGKDDFVLNIGIERKNGNLVVISYNDNGTPFEKRMKYRDSISVMLIELLIKQLKGEYFLDCGKNSFSFQFTNKES